MEVAIPLIILNPPISHFRNRLPQSPVLFPLALACWADIVANGAACIALVAAVIAVHPAPDDALSQPVKLVLAK